MFTNIQLQEIFEKTSGHCHFCGDPLEFKNYGVKDINKLEGAWEADHIIQKGKGGDKKFENCLPSCVRCNRLRWHRKGIDLRELILLGLVAKDEIKKKSITGQSIQHLTEKRVLFNQKRRRNTR